MAEKQLNPQRIGLLNSKCLVRVADAEVGTTLEQIKEPGWWSHICTTLNPWDEVWIREESGAWYCKVLVRSVGKVSAEVEVLETHDFNGAKPEAYQREYTDCTVEWGGPHHKWRIRRGLEIIKSGLQSRKQAEIDLADYLKAIAA